MRPVIPAHGWSGRERLGLSGLVSKREAGEAEDGKGIRESYSMPPNDGYPICDMAGEHADGSEENSGHGREHRLHAEHLRSLFWIVENTCKPGRIFVSLHTGESTLS
jgi:hypothetical protein